MSAMTAYQSHGAEQQSKEEDPKLENRTECYRFGMWNVRMLAWKELELIGIIIRYGLDMLEVSESKINGNGMKTVKGVMSVFAGVQEGRAKSGSGGGSIAPPHPLGIHQALCQLILRKNACHACIGINMSEQSYNGSHQVATRQLEF